MKAKYKINLTFLLKETIEVKDFFDLLPPGGEIFSSEKNYSILPDMLKGQAKRNSLFEHKKKN